MSAMKFVIMSEHVGVDVAARSCRVTGASPVRAVHSSAGSAVQGSRVRPQRRRRDNCRTSRSAVDNPPRNTAG